MFAFIIHHSSSAHTDSITAVASSVSTQSSPKANPLDQLSSSQIAVQVARMTGIYESTSVANLADSQNAATTIVPADSQVINKPAVISTTGAKTKQDVVKYVTQPGDTVGSLAVKFGVTSNSIVWSNSISGNTLTPGLSLEIPPVNGMVYSVKSGDTATSIAQRYNADSNQIVSFNDAEIVGFKPGEQIVIPNATIAAPATISNSPSSNFSFGFSPLYGSNGYDFGYCTWWVAQKRAAAGTPVPANLGNASSWYALAQSAGIPTGGAPQANAVLWFGYAANHVAYVQSVNADGSVNISEMNRAGWDVSSTRTLTPEQAASYKYIY